MIGLTCLKEICSSVSIPVVSIGGITTSNAVSTIEAGCAGIAVVSALFNVEDIVSTGKELMSLVNNAQSGVNNL